MRARAIDLMPRVFEEGPWRLKMHVRRLDPSAWLLVTEHHGAEVEQKRRLLENGADVLAQTEEAAPAIAETLGLVESFLAERHPGLLPGPAEADPLRRIGLLVQEDFCWLAPGPEGYRLVAAFVAFPSRWRLEEKMGRPLAAIHAPVPALESRIGGALQRLFETLAPDRPLWRANWSVLDDPALHQPAPRTGRRGEMAPAAPGDELFVRVERQTLRRLPETGLVLFTIHSFVVPLDEIAADPASARALRARLEEMPAEMRAYKSIERLRPALDARLAGRREVA